MHPRNNEQCFTFCIVGYFYPDEIIKYDKFSTPQIDGAISKETLYSSSQR
jgi:hypothetical protein